MFKKYQNTGRKCYNLSCCWTLTLPSPQHRSPLCHTLDMHIANCWYFSYCWLFTLLLNFDISFLQFFLTLFNKPLTPHPTPLWFEHLVANYAWTSVATKSGQNKAYRVSQKKFRIKFLRFGNSGHFLAQSVQKCQQVSRESKSAQNGQKMTRVAKSQKILSSTFLGHPVVLCKLCQIYPKI